jgi:hypothetical protein
MGCSNMKMICLEYGTDGLKWEMGNGLCRRACPDMRIAGGAGLRIGGCMCRLGEIDLIWPMEIDVWRVDGSGRMLANKGTSLESRRCLGLRVRGSKLGNLVSSFKVVTLVGGLEPRIWRLGSYRMCNLLGS